MPQRSTTCAGCSAKFTLSGYAKHLSTTTNHPCRQIYQQQLAYIPQSDPDIPADADPMSATTPSPSGDIFDQDLSALDVIMEEEPMSQYGGGSLTGQGDAVNLDSRKVAEDSDDEDLDGDLEDEDPDDEDIAEAAELELCWEPEPEFGWEPEPELDWEPEPVPPLGFAPSSPLHWPSSPPQDLDPPTNPDSSIPDRRHNAEHPLHQDNVRVVHFPSPLAGAPISGAGMQPTYEQYGSKIGSTSNPYAPFCSKLDWEFARWAKLRGPGSNAITELLQLEGVSIFPKKLKSIAYIFLLFSKFQERLGLSYRNSRELNKLVDNLPQRPHFQRGDIRIGTEVIEVYHRDIMQCLKALYGDPEFASFLKFRPEKHFTTSEQNGQESRQYHEMHTAKWWWKTQIAIEKTTPGATIVPVILSSDKTQLTHFRNKAAYPVYMTIGNIPKSIRRKPSKHAYVLLGYLPTAKLEELTNKAARRRTLCNLFHICMRRMTEPLIQAGKLGVEMASGDGVVRRIHPIVATYIGDYPEQLLVTAIKNGECPICPVPHKELGDNVDYGIRGLQPVLDALDAFDTETPAAWNKTCKMAGIRPIPKPFWSDLPYFQPFQSITSDVLHQVYQGVVKHLVSWLKTACSATEIDACCRRLPPNHNIRVFLKGITSLSWVTGKEHDQMCRILLGLIVDIPLPHNQSPAKLLRAVRAMLDFVYLAQYPVHTTETLKLLEDALDDFHRNKSVFVDLGARTHFNIPKLHALLHYVHSIQTFGTIDNYNTEYTERLHIDLIKDAYDATNSKDEYPQMTKWLERREKMYQLENYILWRLQGARATVQEILQHHPRLVTDRQLKMPHHPTLKAVPMDTLMMNYGAKFFGEALARFVVTIIYPGLSKRQVEDRADALFLPTYSIPVFHCLKFVDLLSGSTLDAVHAKPSRTDKYHRNVPGRFDTVLVRIEEAPGIGVKGWSKFICISYIAYFCLIGYCVAQVRVIFSIPRQVVASVFPAGIEPEQHLAYVEWFKPFSHAPESNHIMYQVSRHMAHGDRIASIIPISSIRCSVHLFPKFGQLAPRFWTSSNVLEECSTFFVNPFADRYTYNTVY
jgi:hypothetical protein